MNILSAIHRELLARRIGKVLGAEVVDTPNQRHAAFAVLRAARLVSVGNWLAHKAQGRLALLESQLAKDIMAHASGFGNVQATVRAGAPLGNQNARKDGVHQTETPEFKAWFGDSKVVDKDGKPLEQWIDGRGDGRTLRAAVAIAEIKEPMAETDFGLTRKDGREIGDAVRRVENKDDDHDNYTSQLTGQGSLYVFHNGEKVLRVSNHSAGSWSEWGTFSHDQKTPSIVMHKGEDYRDAAKRWLNEKFSATQIKSAIGNKGTWSKTDPNITATIHAASSDGFLSSLFTEYQRQVAACFDWLKGELTDDMGELLSILHKQTISAGAGHFGMTGEIPLHKNVAIPTVLGAPLSDHMDKVASDLLFRLKAETRKAVEAGCTAAETVQRLGLDGASVQATVRAGDVAGHEFHGNQYTSEQLSAQEDLKEYRSQFSKLMNSTVKESGQDAENKLGDIAEKHGLPRHIALADHFENILRDKAGLERPAVMQMGNRDFRREETGTWTHTGGRAGTKVNPETSTKLESLFQANKPVHATIHAALDPLSAISIGIRLFDTTDNSIMKFIQAAVTELASDADAESFEALGDDAPRMGTVWIAVSDINTCDFCEFMDGSRWDENDEPIDGGPELEVEPPAHHGCRCSRVPCDLDAEAPAGNFESYLSRFSNEEQTQAFGPTALKEYRAGRLSPAGLMGQDTNEITLKKFRSLDPRLDYESGAREEGRRSGEAAAEDILRQRAITDAEKLGLSK